MDLITGIAWVTTVAGGTLFGIWLEKLHQKDYIDGMKEHIRDLEGWIDRQENRPGY